VQDHSRSLTVAYAASEVLVTYLPSFTVSERWQITGLISPSTGVYLAGGEP